MKREYKCADCGIKIVIESSKKDDFPSQSEKLLCQKCDPGFASLLDNKYHKKEGGQ